MSPDGNSVVVETERADSNRQIFRKELWLYRVSTGTLLQLTQSGHETLPEWSPDGQWIAFLSESKASDAKDGDEGDSKAAAVATTRRAKDSKDDKEVDQLFLISPNGGEAFPITTGDESVHAFAWSRDSKSIIFATRQPWNKQQNDDHKKEWKDVIRFRGDERGDVIFRLTLQEALARHSAMGSKEISDAEKDSGATPGTVAISHTPLRVEEIAISHDGLRLAYVTSSVSERQEKVEDSDLYLVSLANLAGETTSIRLTHNDAVELNLSWAPDNRHLFFQTNLGSLEKKYEDPQPRLYSVDTDDPQEKKQVQRWFGDYPGEVVHYASLPDGSALCSCRVGTEVQFLSQASPIAPLVKHEGWPGTYEAPAVASQAPVSHLRTPLQPGRRKFTLPMAPTNSLQAKPITSFNKLFSERDLPQAKPYRWTSDDGTPVEGMLMYPPGRFEAKNLPMFVFIHGGPQDADGNHFEADWYQWDRLAATAGWLVFEPNYSRLDRLWRQIRPPNRPGVGLPTRQGHIDWGRCAGKRRDR